PSGNSPGQDLLKIHAAGFALTARARADHEIMRSSCDRLDGFLRERRNVAAIAIEKHYDLWFRRNRANGCRARSPVTPRCSYDACARFMRPLGWVIYACVIEENNFARPAPSEAITTH